MTGQQAACGQVSLNSAFSWSLLLSTAYNICSSSVWALQQHCVCLGYEHHYSFCVFGGCNTKKSAKPKQLPPCQLFTEGVACWEVTWPNDLKTRRSQYTGIPLDRLHWNHTGWCYRPMVFLWHSSVNLHKWNTLGDHWSHKCTEMPLECGTPVAIQC